MFDLSKLDGSSTREMEHLKTLKTQSEIERAIINNRWG